MTKSPIFQLLRRQRALVDTSAASYRADALFHLLARPCSPVFCFCVLLLL